jgi:hypothetical protein
VGVQSYTVRCYRETPGDTNCHDVPAFGEDDLGDIVEQAGFLLLAYANDPKRPPEQTPHTADIEDEHGYIVARIRISGPGTIERVSN